MIAQYNPVTTIFLSLFFAVLKIGAQGIELIGVPSQIYLIMQTVIIFFMAAEKGISESVQKSLQARRAKQAAIARMKGGVSHE